ncbi:hypothetical protein Scep_027511 [Stephania cephalantha]|uniref:Uncharacterized protein n=1 Tax=Stephania cephalantha TaxID=152367 RepID=A0AAP0E884_9MAGN
MDKRRVAGWVNEARTRWCDEETQELCVNIRVLTARISKLDQWLLLHSGLNASDFCCLRIGPRRRSRPSDPTLAQFTPKGGGTVATPPDRGCNRVTAVTGYGWRQSALPEREEGPPSCFRRADSGIGPGWRSKSGDPTLTQVRVIITAIEVTSAHAMYDSEGLGASLLPSLTPSRKGLDDRGEGGSDPWRETPRRRKKEATVLQERSAARCIRAARRRRGGAAGHLSKESGGSQQKKAAVVRGAICVGWYVEEETARPQTNGGVDLPTAGNEEEE